MFAKFSLKLLKVTENSMKNNGENFSNFSFTRGNANYNSEYLFRFSNYNSEYSVLRIFVLKAEGIEPG